MRSIPAGRLLPLGPCFEVKWLRSVDKLRIINSIDIKIIKAMSKWIKKENLL
jgi:hypothetical protein